MKRSASLRLVLMGSAALTLTACDESVEVGVFESVEQCQIMGYSQSACETAIQAATREHLQSAPRYASKADCEAEFGRCEAPAQAAGDAPPVAGQNPAQTPGQVAQNQGGGFGSFFMPMMAGYMIGNMMGNRGAMAQPLYRPVGETARTAGGGLFAGNGTRVAGGAGLTRMPESTLSAARAPAATTSTMSRGGFGARANSVSVAS